MLFQENRPNTPFTPAHLRSTVEKVMGVLSRRHDTFKSFTGYQGSSGSCHAALWGDAFRDAVKRRHEALLRDPEAILPLVRWLLCDTRRTYSEWRLGKAVAVKLGERAFTECVGEWYDESKGKGQSEESPPPKGAVGKGRTPKTTPPAPAPSNEQPPNASSTPTGGVA